MTKVNKPSRVVINLVSSRKFCFINLMILSGVLVSQLGCSPSDKSNLNNTNDSSANSFGNITAAKKIFVDEAMLEQIKPHKTDCHSAGHSKKSQICVKICHVPPGDATAAQSKVIPIQALAAHLNHGHSDIEDRDYLGDCLIDPTVPVTSGTSTTSTDPISTDPISTDPTSTDPSAGTGTTDSGSTSTDPTSTDPSSTDPTSTDTSSAADTTSTDTSATDTADTGTVTPLWCQPYLGVDSDCDGFDDVTGEPLF